MDVYTEVKGSIGNNAETINSQTMEILHRWWHKARGLRMDLSVILKHLDPTDLDTQRGGKDISNVLFTVGTLMQQVPGLNEVQAERVLISSQQQLDEGHTEVDDPTNSILRIQKMDQQLEQLHEFLHHSALMAGQFEAAPTTGVSGRSGEG